MEMGKELKNLRIANGMSRADVAKKLGYSTGQFVYTWEIGRSTPPPGAVKTLSKIFKSDDLEHTFIEAQTESYRERLIKKMKRVK